MYYYNNELPLPQGWLCPKCGRVNAPWLPTCGCVSSQTIGSHEIAKDGYISSENFMKIFDKPQTERND